MGVPSRGDARSAAFDRKCSKVVECGKALENLGSSRLVNSPNPKSRQNDHRNADATCDKVFELTVPPSNIELANFENPSADTKGAADDPGPPSRISEDHSRVATE
jgi:hypothetical protein